MEFDLQLIEILTSQQLRSLPIGGGNKCKIFIQKKASKNKWKIMKFQ